MNSRNTIQEELKELDSALPAHLTAPSYQVPTGYFENFPAAVLARIKAEGAGSAAEEIDSLSPLLAGLSRKMPFSVPDNYFEDNTGTLVPAAQDEESLVLSFISREMPYEVPLGYFAGFPEQMLERVSKPGAKVVPLFARKWMKMAVAAVFAGVMAISGILYFNRGGSPASSDQTVATEVKKASTEELNAFLKTTDITNNTTVASAGTPKAKDVKSLLKDVPDKELEAFLASLPSDDVSDDELLGL